MSGAPARADVAGRSEATAQTLRRAFEAFWRRHGHVQLPEVSLINRGSAGTYFIGSALTPHLRYFIEPSQAPSDRMFTAQRVFWTRRADLGGHSALWNLLQVMLSFYALGVRSIDEHLELMRMFLVEDLRLSEADLFVIAERRDDILTQVRRAGFAPDRVIAWTRMMQFSAHQLRGTYVRIVLRYRHGLIPLWDLIYIPRGDAVDLDSCMLLERVSFVVDGASSWFETPVFGPFMRYAPPTEPLVYEQVAVIARAVIGALADGADCGARGAGHVVRRLFRTGRALARQTGAPPLRSLAPAAFECLQAVGYDFSGHLERVVHTLEREERLAQDHERRAVAFLEREVARRRARGLRVIGNEEFAAWTDSRGIAPTDAIAFLEQQGYAAPTPPVRVRPVLMTDLYPRTVPDAPIADARAVLEAMEHRYLPIHG